MYTYTELSLFEQAARTLKLLKVLHDCGYDMALFKEVNIRGDYNSPEGHCFRMLERVMGLIFQNSEVYRIDYDYEKAEALSLLSYWLQKDDVESEHKHFSGLFVILDDRFDFRSLPSLERDLQRYTEYTYVQIPEGVIVLYGETYEFETDWSLVLQELLACQRVKTTTMEDTNYEIAI